ncbi:M14 family zinc carboxypeptidase [Pleionea sp. CnH1-48]|uniref:M14 family zinc carboxypeptidase n=1 Tax=Pleionea sp. CnH1-48 TaxID=2954494 RepID=UPI002097193C|nr:M14 family zinc carboxypeptidase [Pleionea sp. CnH1-48]MCO7227068.1 peptidase [Pleionea sp. CnH1-48]
MKIKTMIPLALSLLAGTLNAAIKLTPTPLDELNYQGKMLTGEYNKSITLPEDILGFPVGQRVASPEQISQAVVHWDQQSDRIKAFEYARSHEGRPLHYLLISSPENLAKADEIKTQLAKLSNPKQMTESEAKSIIKQLPGVAWMSYSIHGNESSGADAALAAIYHLAASESAEIKQLLKDLIIIVDPLMNPDGRARFSQELEINRSVAANVDNQSVLHTGTWPYGRTNHYYFDLNRDFILGVHPETRGRVTMINEWHPQLMIDGHEMGPMNTYLFAPAREPINTHISKARKQWGLVFANDQAEAFDQEGWRYYTGEWFENLYPGYSSYAEFRGAVHILYEQARIAEDGIRRPEGRIETYKEAVHHQFVSTFANLKTLQKHSQAMYLDYFKEKKENISSKGPYADRSFAILPSNNHSRIKNFIDLMQLQGFELYVTTKELAVSDVTDQLGRKQSKRKLPKGTLIIPNRQAEARLVAAMLEFDTPIKKEVLVEERQRNLRDGSSLMYDTTAWNITMMHGLEAVSFNQYLTSSIEAYKPAPTAPVSLASESTIAIAVQGDDDASNGFAARLMEQGIQLRALDKKTTLGDIELSRGSILITKTDNRNFQQAIALAQKESETLSITLFSVEKGLGEGDLPDWGGKHFRLLKRPQIALLSGNNYSSYDVGAIWHSIDSHLGIRFSRLDSSVVDGMDLRRYNVLVLPHKYGKTLSKNAYQRIDQWVKNGGTLVAIDGSVRDVIENNLTTVKQLSDVLDKAEDYDISLQRERLALSDEIDMEETNQHIVSDELKYPWDLEVKRFKKDQLEKRDQWQQRFMPSGAMIAARSDQKHWMNFGIHRHFPLLFADNPLLMSDDSSEATARIGILQDKESGKIIQLAQSVLGKRKAIGWSTLPEDHDLIVRMSGLLWPEAAQRIANTAAVTREQRGAGQVILFAAQPNFRGSTKTTNRMLLNALIYGPGLGTRPTIAL